MYTATKLEVSSKSQIVQLGKSRLLQKGRKPIGLKLSVSVAALSPSRMTDSSWVMLPATMSLSMPGTLLAGIPAITGKRAYKVSFKILTALNAYYVISLESICDLMAVALWTCILLLTQHFADHQAWKFFRSAVHTYASRISIPKEFIICELSAVASVGNEGKHLLPDNQNLASTSWKERQIVSPALWLDAIISKSSWSAISSMSSFILTTIWSTIWEVAVSEICKAHNSS